MSSFAINVETMNIQEKFLAMEELWDSLSRQNPKELTPKWHLDILQERENKTNFIDMKKSKEALRTLLK